MFKICKKNIKVWNGGREGGRESDFRGKAEGERGRDEMKERDRRGKKREREKKKSKCAGFSVEDQNICFNL